MVKRDPNGPFIMLNLYSYYVKSVCSLNHIPYSLIYPVFGLYDDTEGCSQHLQQRPTGKPLCSPPFQKCFTFYLEDSINFEDVLLQTLMAVSLLAGR